MRRCLNFGGNLECRKGAEVSSAADYCESGASCTGQGESSRGMELDYRRLRRIPSLSRYPKKHYCRYPPNAYYHQPRTVSVPRKKCHRSYGRKLKRNHHMDETTSVDERKSITSYSSMLTVDVSREMEAVNRDIEEIIRRCDDYCHDSSPQRPPTCCHHRKLLEKDLRGLTQDQLRILAMKRPPLDKLKEVPVALLKPRHPRNSLKEKSMSAPHAKYKTSRDIKNIVQETDALLRNVYKELARGKRQEARTDVRVRTDEDDCHCDVIKGVSDPKPATCFERYLGFQNKCRRYQENRWARPKWKEVFERGDEHKAPTTGTAKHHIHDTNCITEPATLSFVDRKGQKEKAELAKLRDTGVNTEPQETYSKKDGTGVIEDTQDTEYTQEKNFDYRALHFIDDFDGKENSDDRQVKFDPIQDKVTNESTYSRPLDIYPIHETSKTSKHFSPSDLVTKQFSEDNYTRKGKFEDSYGEKPRNSLLLDRNMGLSLDQGSSNKIQEDVSRNSYALSYTEPLRGKESNKYQFIAEGSIGSPKKSGGGDVRSPVESSKSFISQVINRIIAKTVDWQSMNTILVGSQMETGGRYDTHESGDRVVDSSICLEIIKKLTELMSLSDKKQLDSIGDVSAQFSRVMQLKQEHLITIEKEIKYIQDLEFYLKNASPARNRD